MLYKLRNILGILLMLPLCFWADAVQATASCTVDAYTSTIQHATYPSTSLSYSFSTAGTNRYLVVYVLDGNESGGTNITGVTYNGSSMTYLAKESRNDGLQWIYAYGMAAPPTGSNTVAISATAGVEIWSGAIDFNNASQTTSPIDVSGGSHAITKNLTTTVSVGTLNACVSGFVTDDASGVAAGTNETSLAIYGSQRMFWESNPFPWNATGSSSFTASNPSFSADMGQLVTSIAPQSAAAAPTPVLLWQNWW